jgi:GDPmannose 4,6-dehydratase
VIATGVRHSVRELVELAFSHAGLNWKDHVEVDAKLLRPAEVHTLCGDASKARSELGWQPHVDFAQLVRMMVDADLARIAHSTAKSCDA